MNLIRLKKTAVNGELAAAILASLAALLPLTGLAQTGEQQLQDNLRRARNAAQQLEVLANDCLDENAGNEACSAFRKALDGELLEVYLDNCTAAKSWREEFVVKQAQDSAATPVQSEVFLGYLVDIEFLCGDNALARNAASVTPAYRLTNTGPAGSSPMARSLQYQLDSVRQNALLGQQRRILSEGLSTQNERSRTDTQRQFDRLELELIRQQNRQLLPR